MRLQEIPDVFLEKGPVTACSQPLRRCYGALVAFYRVPTKFLMAILCALTTLSRCSHCVHCAVTAFTLRFHGVCTALTAWHLKKYANIRNCSNQNLNPALKTKTGNNYMCNILKGTRNLFLINHILVFILNITSWYVLLWNFAISASHLILLFQNQFRQTWLSYFFFVFHQIAGTILIQDLSF